VIEEGYSLDCAVDWRGERVAAGRLLWCVWGGGGGGAT